MTCIVGMVDGGRVVIGGDSMGSAGCDYDLRANPKVARVGGLIIGVSGSPRVADVLHYWLDPPAVEGDPMRWMVRVLVPVMQATFRANALPLESSEQFSWAVLVAAGGRLFAVYDDWQVEETTTGYATIGCGGRIASGAVHALLTPGLVFEPREIVERALMAAEACDPHVRAPFVILEA